MSKFELREFGYKVLSFCLEVYSWQVFFILAVHYALKNVRLLFAGDFEAMFALYIDGIFIAYAIWLRGLQKTGIQIPRQLPIWFHLVTAAINFPLGVFWIHQGKKSGIGLCIVSVLLLIAALRQYYGGNEGRDDGGGDGPRPNDPKPPAWELSLPKPIRDRLQRPVRVTDN